VFRAGAPGYPEAAPAGPGRLRPHERKPPMYIGIGTIVLIVIIVLIILLIRRGI
jgi:hypothetical protein